MEAEGSRESAGRLTWTEILSQFGRGMRFVERYCAAQFELGDNPSLTFDAGVDAGRAWHLVVFVNNDKLLDRLIDGKSVPQGSATDRIWSPIQVDLSAYRKQPVVIRLYDLVLLANGMAGNSYWRKLELR